MSARKLYIDDINTFIESQLTVWPLANENFKRLSQTRRKSVKLGDLTGGVQFNPARVVSTGASVDKDSIAARPCFLCKENRPEEQGALDISDGWELLLNPFPILPVHLTIAHKMHIEQGSVPLDMASMAETATGLTFFYNGARAGASAPDHRHAQAVLTSELPLMMLCEKHHSISQGELMLSEDMGLELPFQFISTIITPDSEGMRLLCKAGGAFGIDADTGESDKRLVNSFFWIGNDGLLRIVTVPRRRHRPSCYFYTSDDKLMVSPGAIDMAGLMITPREKDFEKVDENVMKAIYGEVAFAGPLPEVIKEYWCR